MNAILIPAYKPDMKLVELCSLLLTHEDLSVVVVDDGSGEEFANVFSALDSRVHFITYPVNKGKGGALKTGIRYILDNLPECSFVITADADGQHRYEDIKKVIDASVERPGALVLGSRKFDESNVPARSRMGNSITRFVFKAVSGVKVYDTQTGLRGFDRNCMQVFADVPGDRYEYEINVLLKAVSVGIPIVETWIKTVYIEENQSSHFSTVKDSYRIYKCIFHYMFCGFDEKKNKKLKGVKRFAKFACSGVFAFLIEYVILLLLANHVAIKPANIIARILSSIVNFYVNKVIVFKSKENLLSSACKYALLVLCVLVIDTFLLDNVFVKALNLPLWLAKPVTETIMFFINYFVQRKFVYKKQK